MKLAKTWAKERTNEVARVKPLSALEQVSPGFYRRLHSWRWYYL
ncbi:hypothetical protein [Selenomonas ruminantium]|nr:hypothetical protein [Selenomonas ruminantium]